MAAVQEQSRRTPLYKEQLAQGARFVSFSGWEMPIQFSGILKEHRAVRSTAGLTAQEFQTETVLPNECEPVLNRTQEGFARP